MPTVTHAMQISKHTIQTNHREAEEGRETEADVGTGTTHREKKDFMSSYLAHNRAILGN